VPLCPVNAIYPEAEVPSEYEEWIEKNAADLCDDDNRITDTSGELEGAISIEVVKQKEEEKFGAALEDPSSAAH
jgi:hypothetical protein